MFRSLFWVLLLISKAKKEKKKKKLFGENIQSSQHKKNSWNHILKTRWLQIKCIPLSADCVEKCGENLAKDLKSQVLTEITWCVRLLYCWVDVQMFLTLISLWNLPHEIQNKHFLTWKNTCNGEKKAINSFLMKPIFYEIAISGSTNKVADWLEFFNFKYEIHRLNHCI